MDHPFRLSQKESTAVMLSIPVVIITKMHNIMQSSQPPLQMGGLFFKIIKMKTKNTCPVLNINYSKETEKSQVRDVLSKATWYKKQGYAGMVRLPGDVTLEEIKENIKKSALLDAIDKEYNETLFCEIASDIQENWLNICKEWSARYIDEMSLIFYKSYEINLTRYGTGGSYEEPHKITLNIHDREPKMLTRIIFHEMIHLAIEPLIKKYEVSHWRKERIVDLLYEKILPEFSFKQKIPEEAHAVNSIFKKYPKDIESVIKNSGA